jgi:low affinity Fe/Cu permease
VRSALFVTAAEMAEFDSESMVRNRSAKTSTFSRLAQWCETMTGRPATFIAALGLIVVWLISGPVFAYSDTWQLVINTGTTIITFLMVFLIQNSQNRHTQAMQIKLDELIRVMQGAHVALLDLEELTDEELATIRKDYAALAAKARQDLMRGRSDTDTPEVATRNAS